MVHQYCRASWYLWAVQIVLSTATFAQELDKDSLQTKVEQFQQTPGYEKDTAYIKTLNHLAYRYWSTVPDSVMAISKRALLFSNRIGYQRGEVVAMINIGTAHYEKGNFQEAMEVERDAMIRAEKMGLRKEIGVLCINLSMVYMDIGLYEKAQQLAYRGLEIATENGYDKQVARNHWTLGQVHELQGNLQEARKSFARSKALYDRAGYKDLLHMLDIRIGRVYLKENQPATALGFYEKALKESRDLGHRAGMVRSFMALGDFLEQTGNPTEAMEKYAEAANIAMKLGTEQKVAEADLKVAKCLLGTGKPEEAYVQVQRGLRLARKINHMTLTREGVLVLSEIQAAKGDYKAALDSYREYTSLGDSLMNQEVRTQLVRAEEQFRHGQEIRTVNQRHQEQLLRQRNLTYFILVLSILLVVMVVLLFLYLRNIRRTNRIQKLHQEEIDAQNRELERMGKFKDRILSVVAHDVKTPLNSLKSTVDMYREGMFTKEEMGMLTNDISMKLNEVNFFVNDLVLWAKSQMTEASARPVRFEIKEIVEKTISLLLPDAKRKGIEVLDRTGPGIVFADVEMVKIVVRNFLANAIKYSGKGDGIIISSSIQSGERLLVVSVEDTGTGIPAEKLPHIFDEVNMSTEGTHHEIGTGLGLVLSRQYMEMNHGKIGVESEQGKGSTFWFALPLAEQPS
ncbi:sensor histidine kinase [Echinicola rosea]|uniref:sensor histidine kinase n=3 Tax=Echinicola rosea TaxID=1807691 RepID=UPI0016515C69|nr:ATP-binding protein [Echinicola rosea]